METLVVRNVPILRVNLEVKNFSLHRNLKNSRFETSDRNLEQLGLNLKPLSVMCVKYGIWETTNGEYPLLKCTFLCSKFLKIKT